MWYSLNSYAYENEINNISEDEKDKYIFKNPSVTLPIMINENEM